MSPDQLSYTDKERLGLRATLAYLKSDRLEPAKHKTCTYEQNGTKRQQTQITEVKGQCQNIARMP